MDRVNSLETCDSLIFGLLSAVSSIHLNSTVMERLNTEFIPLLGRTGSLTFKSCLIQLMVDAILYSDSSLKVWIVSLEQCFLVREGLLGDFVGMIEKVFPGNKLSLF